MLAMLEVGSIALLVAIIIMAAAAPAWIFSAFAQAGAAVAVPALVGVLFVVGFGAKLGLLPFYEWFPGAYGSGSGASGAVMSGVVLNAAYFGLSRSLMDWLPSLHIGRLRASVSLSSPSGCSARSWPCSTPSNRKIGAAC